MFPLRLFRRIMTSRAGTVLAVKRPRHHWTASLGGSSRHERRVSRIAVRLFDLLAPIHQMNRRHRKLLRLAALVHDAGRSISSDGHAQHGAELVLRSREIDVTEDYRRALAYLVRYHAGPVPALRDDEILLPGDGRRKLLVLLSLLRAADGLDSRRLDSTAIIAQLKSQRLSVRCMVRRRLARAQRILHRKAKFKLLEEMLGLRVKLRVTGATLEPLIN